MSSSIAYSLFQRSLCRCLRSSSAICKQRSFSSVPSSSPISRFSGRVSILPQNLSRTTPFFSVCFSSSAAKADEKLSRVLESEIECAKQVDDGRDLETILPKNFPFEIIDNPGDQVIILKREFAGEKIQATAFLNIDDDLDAEADADDDDDNDSEDHAQPATISMVVRIDKGVGRVLEFNCNLNSDELSIESLSVKGPEDSDEGAYGGPSFTDLDETLQNSLLKYLEVRGIKGSLFDCLHEYMMLKEDREYMLWLKNMKEFIGK